MTKYDINSTDLPDIQARTHCVLIPRDPNYIYAYWNYTQEDIDKLRNQLKFEDGDSQLILRVYDISQVRFNGSNANHTWDLDVGFSAKDWYIHVWQDNADYCAEFGIRYGEDQFIPLMRSNTVRTPPKSASTRNDLIWQDIKAHRESRPYLKENIKERYQRLMGQHSKKKNPIAKSPRKARIYHLTPQDIRDYYRRLFNWVSSRGRKKAQALAPAKVPWPSMENILKSRPGTIPWQKVNPILTRHDLIRRTHPGASMGFEESMGASESLSSPQSGASEGRLSTRKFFFEIWTELIVHGRTEPDATVWLNSNGVKLNPDGTFTLRYGLPDGEIPLKFIAQASDGMEQRHIYTRVEREKTISFPKLFGEFHG